MVAPITLQTVADAANVSVSTASRALRGHSAISEESTARVRQVAQSLNYRPLRKRRTARLEAPLAGSGLAGKRLAVVSLGMDRSLLLLPAVAEAISGAEEAVSARGAQLQLLHVPDLNQSLTAHANLELDGVFLVGAMQGRHVADSSSAFVRKLMSLPRVWLLGRPDGCSGDAVGVNDFRLGAMAADYLAEHGHQQVAFVGPKPDHVLMMRREDGFCAQGFRRGLTIQRYVEAPAEGWSLPLKPPSTIDSVQTLIDRLLDASPRPTALFAATDSVAAMCYRALAVRGMRVGQDISVISGNNDETLIQCLYPQLTTFDIHALQLGRLAVPQLASRLLSKLDLPHIELSLEPTLVQGESVASLALTEKKA
jgi:LacI family transcriptional regulator